MSVETTSKAPLPPPKTPAYSQKPYFEKYFDATHQRPYFFDPTTGESHWEIPEDAVVADMTAAPPVPIVAEETAPLKKLSKEEAKKKEAEEKRREEYRKRQAEIAKLQEENFQAMYPEYYGSVEVNKPNLEEDKDECENQQEVEAGEEEEQNVAVAQNDEQEIDDKEDIEQKLFKIFKNQQTQQLMRRPARRQVKESKKDTAYIEGNYDYNIWYDKYLTDRNVHQEKAPSLFKCNPLIDTGYTKADKFEKKGSTFFCVYFARGACTEGVNCRFYHRIPQEEDLDKANEDNLRDVFGRARHATHKEDHTGVGSFNKECRTLLVTDIQMTGDSVTPVRDMVRLIYEFFSPWGDIEDIHFNSHKCMAFIKYQHRYYAEFAREAMTDQVLTEGSTEPISIKWALDSPFDKSEALRAQKEIEELTEQKTRVLSRGAKNKKASYLQTEKEEEDQLKGVPISERVKMRPEDLVPQIVTGGGSAFMNRRNEKVLDKQQMKERELLLQRQRDIQTEKTFEANLFKDHLISEIQPRKAQKVNDQNAVTYGFIQDKEKILENCAKMASLFGVESQYQNN